MQEILSLLQKLEQLCQHKPCSQIEKDLLLQYTRDLYDRILLLQLIPSTSSIEPLSPQLDTEVVTAATDAKAKEFDVHYDSKSKQSDFTVLQNALEDKSDTLIESEEDFNEFFELEEELLEDNAEFESLLEIYDNQKNHQEGKVESEQENWIKTTEVNANEEPVGIDTEMQSEPTVTIQQTQTPSEKSNDNQDSITVESFDFLEQKPAEFKLWQKDIRTYIGINDKYNFISELFDNNAEAYEEILNEINLIETKEEATKFLENSGVTTLYDWKEDGFSEQIFYNVLSQFFSSK